VSCTANEPANVSRNRNTRVIITAEKIEIWSGVCLGWFMSVVEDSVIVWYCEHYRHT